MGKKTLIKNLPDLNKARVRNAGFNIEYDNIVPSSFLLEKLGGKNYFIRTYGCQANVRDEETMSGILDLVVMNKVDSVKDADVSIINSCADRENAEDPSSGNPYSAYRVPSNCRPYSVRHTCRRIRLRVRIFSGTPKGRAYSSHCRRADTEIYSPSVFS